MELARRNAGRLRERMEQKRMNEWNDDEHSPQSLIAYYLYCLADPKRLSAVHGVGVDGINPLFLRSMTDIVALLSKVELKEFCGPDAEQRMQELAWIGPRTCRHEKIVEQAMRYSPVLPARFATLFSSLEKLEAFLTENRDALSKSLALLANKEEWAIKGLLNRARAKEALADELSAAEDASSAALSPGVRYLREKQIRTEADNRLKIWLRNICSQIAAELGEYVSDFSERSVISLGETDHSTDTILNWAFLVPNHAVAAFCAHVERANAEQAQRGLVLALSGPWPPYSFCPSLAAEAGA